MGDPVDKSDKSAVDASRASLATDDGPALSWSVHPVKRKPMVSVAVSAFIVVIAWLVHSWMQSPWFTILALVIMLGSLAKFYFPTSYKLSARGVTVKTTTQTLFKEWSIYRSCYPDRKGILLSPFVEPSRLENFRGLYIMFEGNNEQVTAFCRQQIAAAHRKGDLPSTSQSPDNEAAR